MKELPQIDESQVAKLINYTPNSWQAKVDEEDARFLTLNIGRRGGKTQYVVSSPKHGIVRDFLLPDQHVWIVAPNYDLTQRVWNEVEKLAHGPLKPFVKRFQNTKGNYRIETVLGTIIEAKSAEDPELLIGVGLTKLIIDEASRVKEKAWYQALRPALADKKGKAIFISTPRGHNWFKEMFDKGQNPEEELYKSFQFTTYDNDYLDRDEIEQMVSDMPEYEYNQEILAKFTSNIEQVFDMERFVKGTIVPPQVGATMGMDLGKSLTYTVIIAFNPDGTCCYFDRFREDWNETIRRAKEAYRTVTPAYFMVDATGRGDPIVEQLIDAGIPVEPFIFSAISKKQLIDKAAFIAEKGLIQLPDEKQLWDELASYGRTLTESNNYIYKPLRKITDDCVDSFALALWEFLVIDDTLLRQNQEQDYATLFGKGNVYRPDPTDFL